MKQTSIAFFILVIMYVPTICLGQSLYSNAKYKFEVKVPDDWSFYHEIKDDNLPYTIIGWGMPKTYSEPARHEIENAVSITAVQVEEIKCVKDLIAEEQKRTQAITTKRTEVDWGDNCVTLVSNSTIKGIDYISKQYFIFKDGIGYIINFTATPCTYDTNIPKFEEFYKTVDFL